MSNVEPCYLKTKNDSKVYLFWAQNIKDAKKEKLKYTV